MSAIANRSVLFLGAGASYPFGYPLTAGILPKIWSGLHIRAGTKGSWSRWAGMKGRARDAKSLIRCLQALLPGLQPKSAISGGVSIVDAISLMDQMIAEGRTPDPQMNASDVVQARRVLDRAINGVLQGRSKLHYAKRLAEWILRAATESDKSRMTVISTNYDTTIENELFRRLVRNGVSIGAHVDLGMPWRDAFISMLHSRPQDAHLAFMKLHGSLNWLRCELCGRMTVNVTQRIASLGSWEKRSPRGYNICHCNGLLRSHLVTPSVVRDVRDSSLLGIWTAALEDLRQADEWVLVGYSMPPEDISIRSLLLRAWNSRRRTRLRVRIVQFERPEDPRPSPTESRYRILFPESALADRDYSPKGVEHYLDRLELLPAGKIDARITKYFAGWSAIKIRQRERERRAQDAERRLVGNRHSKPG